MAKEPYEGDSYISAFHLKLWSLVQEVLIRWQTLVIFKHIQYSVPDQTPGLIEFFVPADCRYRYEIVKFLEYELEKEKIEEHEMDCGGEKVTLPRQDACVTTVVHTFSGVPGHVDRDICEQMAAEAARMFMLRLKEMRKDKGEDDE